MTPPYGDKRLTGAEGRDRLLRAAVQATLESDIADFTVRDVAARAGVNHGLVHRYFSTKDLLVAAVIDELAQGIATTVTCDTDSTRPLLDARGRTLALLLARSRLSENFDVAAMAHLTPIGEALAVDADGRRRTRSERRSDALLLAATLGWTVNEPFLKDLYRLSDSEVEALHERLREAL